MIVCALSRSCACLFIVWVCFAVCVIRRVGIPSIAEAMYGDERSPGRDGYKSNSTPATLWGSGDIATNRSGRSSNRVADNLVGLDSFSSNSRRLSSRQQTPTDNDSGAGRASRHTARADSNTGASRVAQRRGSASDVPVGAGRHRQGAAGNSAAGAGNDSVSPVRNDHSRRPTGKRRGSDGDARVARSSSAPNPSDAVAAATAAAIVVAAGGGLGGVTTTSGSAVTISGDLGAGEGVGGAQRGANGEREIANKGRRKTPWEDNTTPPPSYNDMVPVSPSGGRGEEGRLATAASAWADDRGNDAQNAGKVLLSSSMSSPASPPEQENLTWKPDKKNPGSPSHSVNPSPPPAYDSDAQLGLVKEHGGGSRRIYIPRGRHKGASSTAAVGEISPSRGDDHQPNGRSAGDDKGKDEEDVWRDEEDEEEGAYVDAWENISDAGSTCPPQMVTVDVYHPPKHRENASANVDTEATSTGTGAASSSSSRRSSGGPSTRRHRAKERQREIHGISSVYGPDIGVSVSSPSPSPSPPESPSRSSALTGNAEGIVSPIAPDKRTVRSGVAAARGPIVSGEKRLDVDGATDLPRQGLGGKARGGEGDEEGGAGVMLSRAPIESNSLLVATDSLGNVRIYAKKALLEALMMSSSLGSRSFDDL